MGSWWLICNTFKRFLTNYFHFMSNSSLTFYCSNTKWVHCLFVRHKRLRNTWWWWWLNLNLICAWKISNLLYYVRYFLFKCWQMILLHAFIRTENFESWNVALFFINSGQSQIDAVRILVKTFWSKSHS